MNACQEFFQRPREKGSLGVDLRALPSEVVISWERLSASLNSPGPVTDDELLYRQMLDPVHWNSLKREPNPGAFTDVETIGMSVNRIAHVNIEALVNAALVRVTEHNRNNPDKPERKFLGFAVFPCSSLRNALFRVTDDDSGSRVLAVFDTAAVDDPSEVGLSHADICRISGGTAEKHHKARAKAILWELGIQRLTSPKGEHIPASDFPL